MTINPTVVDIFQPGPQWWINRPTLPLVMPIVCTQLQITTNIVNMSSNKININNAERRTDWLGIKMSSQSSVKPAVFYLLSKVKTNLSGINGAYICNANALFHHSVEKKTS